MHTIYYTIEITSGHLKGIRIHQKMSFPTVEACAKFGRIGRTVKASWMGPAYTIVDSSFQNYTR